MSDIIQSAERRAAKHGLPNYSAWRAQLERRYTTMPPWYWNDGMCRQNYVAAIDTAVEWQQRTARINAAAAENFRALIGKKDPEIGGAVEQLEERVKEV
jgi:hypothetical protein